jgi:arylsulfatase A-like enzyme
MRWPGHVPAGRASDAMMASIDFLPTFATLAGYQIPTDRIIDGVDQSELLLGKSESGARNVYHYFCQNELQAVRKGPWKLHLPNHKVFYGYVKDRGSGELELYNLQTDIGEKQNVAKEHPDVVADLLKLSQSFEWPARLFDNTIGLPKAK